MEERESQVEKAFSKLLSSAEVRKAIAKIPDVISQSNELKISLSKTQMEKQYDMSRYTTKNLLIFSLAVIGAITIAVLWLGVNEKISSDALTFIFGTIIGSAFGFMRSFLRRNND